MSQSLKRYIAAVVIAAAAPFAYSLTQWNGTDPVRFFTCLAIACLASLLKIRLPGMPSSISANFVVLLASLTAFPAGPVLVIGAVAVLVQMWWKPRTKPEPVQAAFNAAAIMISLSLGHILVQRSGLSEIPALVLAASVFFLADTVLVCQVLSMKSGERLIPVWRRCYLWAAPYYMTGAIVAGLVVLSERLYGWQESILVYPVLFLIYTYFETLMNARVELDAVYADAHQVGIPSKPVARAS